MLITLTINTLLIYLGFALLIGGIIGFIPTMLAWMKFQRSLEEIKTLAEKFGNSDAEDIIECTPCDDYVDENWWKKGERPYGDPN